VSPAARPFLIAIDGPAGAGKSTVSRAVARSLGYRYVDTGAMYRAVAWKARREGVFPEDVRGLARAARGIQLEFPEVKGEPRVRVDGREATRALRAAGVTMLASRVAVHSSVRRALVARQRAMGRKGGVVMEGRDIGTVVFPRARHKFYLDASPLERARRRFRELVARGEKPNLAQLARAIRLRDAQDRGREDSPLRPARDAVVLNTTRISQEGVVRRILARVGG
jgi:cytidylate kinase